MTVATAQNPIDQSYANLRGWLTGADVTKQAGSLPDLDDGGKPATLGAHAAENSADLKKHVAPGQNIDAGKDNPTDGNTNKPVPDSGLMQTETGKMPEVEKAVKTVSDEHDKMAAITGNSVADLQAKIASLDKIASAMGILTTAGALHTQQSASAAAPAAAPEKTAQAAGGSSTPAVPAASEDAERQAIIADYVKFADERATHLGEYLRGHTETYALLQKCADDGSLAAMMAQDPTAGGGMPPGGGGGDAAAAAPPSPAAMPSAPPMGGGAPDAGGGDMGGGGGGAGGPPSADELAAAATEMGLSPDVLIQAAHKMQGEVDSAPESEHKDTAKAAVAEFAKLASDTKTHMQTGKFRLKPAADGSPERKGRDAARDYLNEMLQFARR